MAETLNMLYRLFAPLLVVFLIIAGVDLSSELIKNTQAKQTAISIAYAQACETGTSPAVPNKSTKDPKTGKYLAIPCKATVPGGTVPGMTVPGTGCCKANAGQQTAKQAKKAAKGGGGGAGAGKALGKIMEALGKLLQPKPKEPKPPEQQDNGQKPPLCTKLTVSPTLPLRPGESATLTWTLSGGAADAVIVSPGVGAIQGYSTQVTPRTSTTYTAIAKNREGSSTCPKVRVHVGARENNDDSVFNDNGSTTNTAPLVEIFEYPGAVGSLGQDTSRSAYDTVWQGGQDSLGGQDGVANSEIPNEDDAYYDFLSSLAESEDTFNDSQGALPDDYNYDNYYYGDDADFDFSLVEGIAPDWQNADLQDGIIGETDLNRLALGARADNYDTYEDQDYEYDDVDAIGGRPINGNGLTDEEIYGVWNRPQSPATGGLGLSGGYSGGYGSGSSNVPTIDFGGEPENVSVFSQVGGWFKSTFCFWCDDPTSLLQVSSEGQLASSNSFETGYTNSESNSNTRTRRSQDNTLDSQDFTDRFLTPKPFVITWGTSTGNAQSKQTVQVLDIGRDAEYNTTQQPQAMRYKKADNFYRVSFKKMSTPRVLAIRAESISLSSKSKKTDQPDALYVKCKAPTLTLFGVGAYKEFSADKKVQPAFKVATQNRYTTLDPGTRAGKPLVLESGTFADLEYNGYKVICGDVKVKTATTPYKKGGDEFEGSHCDPKTTYIVPEQTGYIQNSGKCIKSSKTHNTTRPQTTPTKDPKCSVSFLRNGTARPEGCDKPRHKARPAKGTPENPTPPKRHPPRLGKKAQVCDPGYRLARFNGRIQCISGGGVVSPKKTPTTKPPVRKAPPTRPPNVKKAPNKGISKADVQRQIQAARAAEQAKAKAAIDRIRAESGRRQAANRKAQADQATRYHNALRKQQAQQKRPPQKQQARKPQQRPPQQRPPQQRPPQQRPPQRKPQQRPPQPQKGLVDSLLAKIRALQQPKFPTIVTKPQCLSFTSNKLKTQAGEEVTLQWAVKGATNIVITPKVRIVEEGGKRVAKTNPESSVQYTLIATNKKGEEHRCQTKRIAVGEDLETRSCQGAIDSVSITVSPSEITRPDCDPEQDGQQCDLAWQGKLVQIGWSVHPEQCVTSCKISNQDGDIWTSSSDLQHKFTDGGGFGNKLGNEGNLRETSTFKIRCEDGFGNVKEDEAQATVTNS